MQKIDTDSIDAYVEEQESNDVPYKTLFTEDNDLDEDLEIKGDVGEEIVKVDDKMDYEEIKLTPIDQVNCLDAILVDLEETLEKDPDLIDPVNGDKRFIRKIKFVAQYMKDMAEAINPVKTEKTTTVTEGTIPVKFIDKVETDENNDDSLTEKDVDDYIVNNLGPTLDKIVKRNLNKLRGKLEDND
jgi:hypothetical protein